MGSMDTDGETRLTVLCVDDNADVAGMLQAMVHSQPGMICCGCVMDGSRVLEEIRRTQPNIVLLDLSMPGSDTLDLIRNIARDHEACRVLICSGYDQQEVVDDVMAAGAWGLVSKHARLDELLDAIRCVADGKPFPGKRV